MWQGACKAYPAGNTFGMASTVWLSVARYERGQRAAFGGALVQRHVALPQDLANKAGKGLLVRPLCCTELTAYAVQVGF